MSEGWIKLHRKFYSGSIANQPPHYREVFIYLLTKANHKDNICSGTLIKRGQLFTSFSDISEKLHWFIGARKEHYKKHHTEKAMNWLRKEGMVETSKTTRGIIVTICNYDTYQDEKNTTETAKESTKATPKSHRRDTINKNEKNDKNDNKNITPPLFPPEGEIIKSKRKNFKPPTQEDLKSFFTKNGSSHETAESFFNYYEANGWHIGRTKMKNWQAAARNWIKRNRTINQPKKTTYLQHDYDEF